MELSLGALSAEFLLLHIFYNILSVFYNLSG